LFLILDLMHEAMTPVLETERLRLKQFTFDDIPFVIELLNSPGWLQFIGDRNVRTPEQAKSYLENGPLKSYALNGYGLCLVERKDDGQPVGMCGILNREALDSPDIGFAFLPAFHGQGYALEIAQATIDDARETWGVSKLAAVVLEANTRSIRLLEKIGLSYVRPIQFPGSEDKLLLYSN
jgi:RimJ/RimL family protein N-acetyltransferase